MYDAAIVGEVDWGELSGLASDPFEAALWARAAGFEFRDTVAVVGPGGWQPVMLFRWGCSGQRAQARDRGLSAAIWPVASEHGSRPRAGLSSGGGQACEGKQCVWERSRPWQPGLVRGGG